MNNELFKYPNVVGHGIGYEIQKGKRTDRVARVVLVTKKLPLAALSDEEVIPTAIGRERTDVIQVGHIIAHVEDPTDYWRPAPGGVSIGHYKITAGTLGVVVKDNGLKAILSNNHVLANSNDAQINDAILQPGPYDEGSADIGYLRDFEPIKFSTSLPTCPIANRFTEIMNWFLDNYRVNVTIEDEDAVNIMDAAIALPHNQDDLSETVLGLGLIQGWRKPSLGMEVTKSGRTTGVTTGTIDVIEATVVVDYGGGRKAMFENQIITSAMSQPGDSGSLLAEKGTLVAVGLLFAGSDQVTIHNPIQPILERFGAMI